MISYSQIDLGLNELRSEPLTLPLDSQVFPAQSPIQTSTPFQALDGLYEAMGLTGFGILSALVVILCTLLEQPDFLHPFPSIEAYKRTLPSSLTIQERVGGNKP